METVNITSIQSCKLSELKRQKPTADGVKMIDGDTIVMLNGEIVAVYQKATCDLSALRSAALALKFSSYVRTSGLVTQTEGINASPRNPTRTNKCTKTKMHRQQPLIHKVFLKYARKMAVDYRRYFPARYATQVKRSYTGVTKVLFDYLIPGTSFTGGVVNKNSQLGFHRDRANTTDGMSCMFILKQGISGGELILPELGIGFACQDGYVLLFDGQKYIHGVTPFQAIPGRKGYRITIVFYNSKGMHLCLPPTEEEAHYRTVLERKINDH